MTSLTGKTDFRLLRFFTTTSLIAFVAVAAMLGFVFRALSINGLIDGYENEHADLARVIGNEMWDQDFGPFVLAMEGKPAAALKASDQIPALHRKVLKLLKGTKTFKIKVYDRKGMTIYSTELKQIGEDKSDNKGVVAGLQGSSQSELTHRDQFSAFEGEVQNRDLVESYIPRYDPATGEVSGVFEIYGDATSVLTEIDRRQWFVVGSVITSLSLLYLSLFVIVKRAQDLIQLQNREIERDRQALSESEERWKFALEGSGEGVWDRNLQTGVAVYSKRYKEIYGYAEDELVDHQEAWDERVHPDDLPLVDADRAAYFSGKKQVYANERRMRCRDGSWKWILSRGMVVARDDQGRPLRMIGTHTDISERHQREEALRLAATVLSTMDEAVVVTDRDNKIVSVNPAFTAITGYLPEEVIGKNPRLLSSGMHAQEFYREMWETLKRTGNWYGEIRNRSKNGRLFVEWLSIKQLRDKEGKTAHYVAVFSDISERKAAEEHMRHMAHFDALTGLPNRSLFADRLQQTIAKARREKSHLALMFIDLDQFKPVNDLFGHHVGDLLLREVASRLHACLRRESDTVARMGGDEFVVILPEIEGYQDAVKVGDKILATLNQPFDIAGHKIHISSSIGIAVFPEHGNEEKLLLRSADEAMYRAKENGRNRLVMAEKTDVAHA
ncbi:MAG: diguanylate cyclase [Proteobacteria bacterium]|nr:diguanylate cyclase [Pseudomonadota bacterium]